MSWAFLAVSLFGACFTLNAFRPVRIEPFTVPSFFAGWLTSELPLHHLAWQVVATVAFGLAGAFRGWPGWLGLAVTLASWCGLAVLSVQAGRSAGVVDGVLRGTLGERWADRMDPSLARVDDAVRARLQLVIPAPRPGPAVERVRDVPYHEDGARRHRLDVYRPKRPVSRAPVFLYLHGGA